MIKNLLTVVILVISLCLISPSFAQEAAGIGEEEVSFYILGPDDIIKIDVWRHPELSGKITVEADGTIILPLTGEAIKVSDLTKDEAAELLEKVMDKYVKAPRVNVTIVAYRSQVYYVFGEVKRPGRFPMKKSVVTLRDALIDAQLFKPQAALGSVHIITPAKEKPTYKVVNANRVLYKGYLKDDIVLKPGDVVYVPTNFMVQTRDVIRHALIWIDPIVGPLKRAKDVAPGFPGGW